MKKNVKMISLLSALLLGLILVSGCATAPAVVAAPGVTLPGVQVSPGQVTAAAGNTVYFTGAGFDPASPVALLIEFGGSLNDIASYTAGGITTNEDGAFVARWSLVAGAVRFLETKTYSVAVMVGDDTVYVPLDVTKP